MVVVCVVICAIAMKISPVSHVVLHRMKIHLTGCTVRFSVSPDEVPLAVLEPDITVLTDQALAAAGGSLDQVLGYQALLVSRRLYSKLGDT